MTCRVVCVFALLVLFASFGFAEDAVDHPLIGRFEGAEIQKQEVSRFGEYTIAVSDEETQTVQGEVWMTLYNAPEDASTFSVYSTYLSFLEQEGFEILLSYEPGDAPGGYLRTVYGRAPFAHNGNYSHSAPITNGNSANAAYIAAHRETSDGEVYVSIAIAAGWNQYPQYKLDVVETGSDSGRIVVEDDADHPLVGRYEGAAVQHQEVSRFGQYTIAVSDEETESVEGEVWMTLYKAPERTSTFSIYATYLSFLEREGFDILLSYKPGEAPGGFVRSAYERAPFADNGNYSHSGPITNGNNEVAAYIAARREAAGGEVYVSLAISAGWNVLPKYKLDVASSGADAGRIVSSGTPAEDEQAEDAAPTPQTEPAGEARTGGSAEADAPAADESSGTAAPTTGDASAGLFGSGTGSFRLRGGMAGFMFLDPNLAGYNEIVSVGGTETIQAFIGFKNMRGPFAELAWFANENLGVGVDASYLMSDAQAYTDDERYSVDAEIVVIRSGPYARVIGSAYPVTITAGVGGGVALADLTQRYEDHDQPANDSSWRATAECLVLASSLELSFPIVGGVSFSGGMEYLFIPTERLTFTSDGESQKSVTYSEPNLGGLSLRLGLALEL